MWILRVNLDPLWTDPSRDSPRHCENDWCGRSPCWWGIYLWKFPSRQDKRHNRTTKFSHLKSTYASSSSYADMLSLAIQSVPKIPSSHSSGTYEHWIGTSSSRTSVPEPFTPVFTVFNSCAAAWYPFKIQSETFIFLLWYCAPQTPGFVTSLVDQRCLSRRKALSGATIDGLVSVTPTFSSAWLWGLLKIWTKIFFWTAKTHGCNQVKSFPKLLPARWRCLVHGWPNLFPLLE